MTSSQVGTDAAVLDAILEAFREHGFEGCSMSVLSTATGLARASLYHRFPGGKMEMAKAAMGRFGAQFQEAVIDPLESGEDAPEAVAAMRRGLNGLYRNGELSCLFEVFSRGDVPEEARAIARAALNRWQAAMEHLCLAQGSSRAKASDVSQQAVLNLAGCLVVGRVMADSAVFTRSLDSVDQMLLGG